MLQDQVFHLIRRIAQEHTARWLEVGMPLTKPQYAVLRTVDESPGLEQTAIAVASATTKATLTEVLTRLESAGLITRRTDDADRRRRSVELTPAGRAALDDVRARVDRVDAELLARLAPDDRERLRRLLTALATEPAADAD